VRCQYDKCVLFHSPSSVFIRLVLKWQVGLGISLLPDGHFGLVSPASFSLDFLHLPLLSPPGLNVVVVIMSHITHHVSSILGLDREPTPRRFSINHHCFEWSLYPQCATTGILLGAFFEVSSGAQNWFQDNASAKPLSVPNTFGAIAVSRNLHSC